MIIFLTNETKFYVCFQSVIVVDSQPPYWAFALKSSSVIFSYSLSYDTHELLKVFVACRGMAWSDLKPRVVFSVGFEINLSCWILTSASFNFSLTTHISEMQIRATTAFSFTHGRMTTTTKSTNSKVSEAVKKKEPLFFVGLSVKWYKHFRNQNWESLNTTIVIYILHGY